MILLLTCITEKGEISDLDETKRYLCPTELLEVQKVPLIREAIKDHTVKLNIFRLVAQKTFAGNPHQTDFIFGIKRRCNRCP